MIVLLWEYADSLDGKIDLSSSLFLCFDFLVQL